MRDVFLAILAVDITILTTCVGLLVWKLFNAA